MEYFIFTAMGYLISTFADLKKIKDLQEENQSLCGELAKLKANSKIIDIQ